MLLAAMCAMLLPTAHGLAQDTGTLPRNGASNERSESDRGVQWACCVGAGCYDISELLCDIHGGIWHEGELCSSGICDGDSGYCAAGFILDCVGNCQLVSWIGDGYCDDGTWGAYFNCAEFGCDGGDCPDSSCNLPSGDGACCTGSGCQVLSYENCIVAGGTYMGEYTQCTATTCSCPGGFIPDCNGYCMPIYLLGDGICNDGDFAYDYPYDEEPPTAYTLDLLCSALACDSGDCNSGDCIGACCLDSACTETLTFVECTQQGGIFGGTFTSCSDMTCEDVILPVILSDTTLELSDSNNGGPLHAGWTWIGRITDSHGALLVIGVEGAQTEGDWHERLAAYVYENGSSEVSQTLYPASVTNGEIRDVATDGSRILLAGGPYAAIYHKPAAEWVLEQLITDNSSSFHSAAISGNRLFLGDRANQRINVYDYSGGAWQAGLIVPDPSSSHSHFATTISADSQTLVATDQGNVYAYDAVSLGLLIQSPIQGRHDYSWNDPPEYSFNDVDVDGEYFIVGDAGLPGGNGYGHVFKRSGSTWASHQFLVPSSANDSQSKIGYAVAINDGRALVTAPQANDARIRSGGASLFAVSNDTWEEVARFLPLRATINMGFGISATLGDHTWFGLQGYGIWEWSDPSMMMAAIPEYIWTGQGDGDVNETANWFPDIPAPGSTASMNMQTRYSAYCMNGSLPFNSLHVGPGRLSFDMMNVNADLSGSLEIAGMRTLAATIGVADGKLDIAGSVAVGSDHRPGTLNLTGDSMIELAGSYIQHELGTLSCQIEQRPAAALKLEGAISIRGALKMTSDGSYGRAGTDSFLIIESKQPPPSLEDRFQIAIMPGLDDGNFYKLVYGTDGRGAYTVSIVIEQLPIDGDLSPPDTVGVGGFATDLLVTDLGSDLGLPDGYADIALTIDGSPGQLYVFLNDGTGIVALQATYNTGNGPSAITSGDYDHDGNIDLVVTNAHDDTFQAYLNTTGDPTAMSPQSPVTTGDNPIDVTTLDIDNDSDVDIVIACAGDGVPDDNGAVYGVIDFFESTPGMRQSFTNKQTLSTGKQPGGIKPGDIDPGGNKDEDVIITLGSSGQVGFLGNPGDDSDWQVDQLIEVGDQPRIIQILPITDSSNKAVLIGNTGSDSMSVLQPDGAGGLEVIASIDLDATPLGMASVDFDADGDRDLAMLVRDEFSVNTIRIYRNDSPLLGDGNIMLAFDQELDTGDNPTLVSSGDTDGDGNDDLVSISGTGPGLRGDGDSMSLRRSQDSAGTCDGDMNGDSVVDVFDLLGVILAWGPCNGCAEDFDSNGVVNVDDLLVVISAWGPCP